MTYGHLVQAADGSESTKLRTLTCLRREEAPPHWALPQLVHP